MFKQLFFIYTTITNIFIYLTYIDIIFTEQDNVNGIAYTVIKKYLDNKINFINFVDNKIFLNKSFTYTKWFYLLMSYFVKINLIFVDIIPVNIYDILSFFKGTSITIEIVTNNKTYDNIINLIRENSNYSNVTICYDPESNLGVANNMIVKYNNDLVDPQKIFFNKIASYNSNQSNMPNELIYFINGITKYNNKMLKSDIMWYISYEGEIAVDLFTSDGSKKVRFCY